jgi:flagellar hook assembly protein FlgD
VKLPLWKKIISVTHLKDFNIFYNYPNPFNSNTQFIFNVTERNFKVIEITIYDILGRTLKKLIPLHLTTGLNKIPWDGTDALGNPISSGLYIAKLKGWDEVKVRKILLIR